MNHISSQIRFFLILFGAVWGWAFNASNINASSEKTLFQEEPLYPRPNAQSWKRVIEDFNAGDETAKQIILHHGVFVPESLIPTLDLSKLGDFESLLTTSSVASYLIFKQHKISSISYPLFNENLVKIIKEEDKKETPQNPYALGWFYINHDMEEDWDKSFKWYELSAQQGFAPAQCNLGYYYLDGLGCEENISQSILWFRAAAEQGFASAQNNIGFYYESGQGVSQDLVQAIKWYIAAAEQGSLKARDNLIKILQPIKDTFPLPTNSQSSAQNFFNLHENTITRPITTLRDQNNSDFEDNVSPSAALFKSYETLLTMMNRLKHVYSRLDQSGFMLTNLPARTKFTLRNLLSGMSQQDLERYSDPSHCPYVTTFILPQWPDKIFTSIGQENVWATYQLMQFVKQHTDNTPDIEKGIALYKNSPEEAQEYKIAFDALLTLPQDIQEEIARSASIRNQKYQDKTPWLFD